MVLYDPLAQQVIRLPASSIILRANNCNRASPCRTKFLNHVTCAVTQKKAGRDEDIVAIGGDFVLDTNDLKPFKESAKTTLGLLEDGDYQYYITLPGGIRRIDTLVVGKDKKGTYLTTSLDISRRR